ncbi:helix-turn-helix domain-containing protein [Nonomuraea sp. NBC_00507]|uniref:helix-turn-helix domain-containing protein n=1 Tax=Nonomuraea sp. NBC_00507 TaxID=2976002 RepID=UPI003FA567F9
MRLAASPLPGLAGPARRPESAGLPAGGHRRAPGLRREELALLAGISVDYITRHEQGWVTSPSGQVVEALAAGRPDAGGQPAQDGGQPRCPAAPCRSKPVCCGHSRRRSSSSS